MPQPKRSPQKKKAEPIDRAILRQVERIKKSQKPRNHDAVIALAQSMDADVADAIELFEERAAIRTYDANDSVQDAEVGALGDVRDILTARAERFASQRK